MSEETEVTGSEPVEVASSEVTSTPVPEAAPVEGLPASE